MVADLQDTNWLVDDLKGQGAPDVLVIQMDVSDEALVSSMASSINERFGRCDIVVNNAGIASHQGLAETSFASWRRVMATNIDAIFLVCRALVPGMAERGYGRVVNVGSDMIGLTAAGFYAYFSSKGGVVGLTRAIANEFGDQGVTANCLAPGLTRTPRSEQEAGDVPIFEMLAKTQAIKRTSLPSDLVGALSFLTSDDAAFMTGQTLIVNGGSIKAL